MSKTQKAFSNVNIRITTVSSVRSNTHQQHGVHMELEEHQH